MAQDLQGDENGDLVVDHNDLTLVNDTDELSQHIWTIIRTQLGSYPLDENAGTDMFSLLGTHFNRDGFQNLIETAVKMQEPRISSAKIINYTVDDKTNLLTIEIDFQTLDGEVLKVKGDVANA